MENISGLTAMSIELPLECLHFNRWINCIYWRHQSIYAKRWL